MKFFQAVLVEIPEDKVLDHCYSEGASKEMKVSDRIDKCPDCGGETWILLPKEGSAVKQGGKPYCECMECGYPSYL